MSGISPFLVQQLHWGMGDAESFCGGMLRMPRPEFRSRWWALGGRGPCLRWQALGLPHTPWEGRGIVVLQSSRFLIFGLLPLVRFHSSGGPLLPSSCSYFCTSSIREAGAGMVSRLRADCFFMITPTESNLNRHWFCSGVAFPGGLRVIASWCRLSFATHCVVPRPSSLGAGCSEDVMQR